MLKISSVLLIRHLKTRDVKLSLYVLKKCLFQMVFWRKLILKMLNFKFAKLPFPVLCVWCPLLIITVGNFLYTCIHLAALTHHERKTISVPIQDCCKEKAVIWASLCTFFYIQMQTEPLQFIILYLFVCRTFHLLSFLCIKDIWLYALFWVPDCSLGNVTWLFLKLYHKCLFSCEPNAVYWLS